MAAPATADQLLDLVRKSGVADEKRLDTYLLKMRDRIPADATKAAEILIRDGLITHFQAENILAGKWRRFTIGKYKVLERLGSGGMGQVFLCEHKLMRRRVAVKVLPPAKTKDSSALDRFMREARALAALTHPNIVHVYDIDQDDELHFLVMEYVDGVNFQDMIKKSGPLAVNRACHYIRQASQALQHAHEAGLVHRDIKPGNILVDRSGIVKVLDLGLARFFHDEDDILTKKYDDGVLGTADYLAPEQALDSHAADIRADIYSLGSTFYFLLSGRPPFESANVTQKLMMHQFRNPKPIQEYRSDVPAGVLAILQKMMAKDPKQRYGVPADVADALAPFTQEKIAPPSEAEMPRLSPAASGAATGQFQAVDATDTAVTKNETPVEPLQAFPSISQNPGAGKPPSGSVIYMGPKPTAAAPTRASASNQAPTTAVAAAPLKAPATKSAPKVAAEIAPWEQAAHDTEDPMANADTSLSSVKSRRRLQTSASNRSLVVVLLIVLLVIPLLLTVIAGAAIWIYFPTPNTQPLPVGPPKLEVSKDPKRPGAFPNIQQALRNAKAGSVIELWDEIHEENLLIDPTKGPTNVTIQAAAGREVLWRPAKNDPELPLVKLAKASEFRLRGKGIILDGTLDNTRRVNELMMITADCTGTAVEDLFFQKFARSAILLMNCTGTADQPIKLHRLTMITDAAEKPRAAIYLDANPKVIPEKNDHIDIQGCEFHGFDPRKAIQFRDNSVMDKDVRWPGR